MFQFKVLSSTATSSEAVNVWNCEDPSAQDAADNLHTWYEWIDYALSDDATYTLDTVARVINPATGVTTGVVPVSWSAPIVGAGAGTRAPDATALLVAHDTGTYVGGRRLQGRTFLPYPSISVTGEGQVAALALSTFQAALDNAQIALTDSAFGIWKRPVGGVGGVIEPISASVIRREYSYIGGRRN